MPRALIIAPSWVGDAIMMQSALALLKRRAPELAIDVFAPAWCADVMRRMPEVAAVIDSPFAHGELALARRWRLAREISHRKYDQAVVFPNSLKSALLPFFAGIPTRSGFLGEQRYGLINRRPAFAAKSLPRLVDRYAGLVLGRAPTANEAPLPHLQVNETARNDALRRLGLQKSSPVVALCPGAEYGPAKRWPVEYFADIARRAEAQNYAIWIFGSSKDAEIGEVIRAEAHHAVNLAGLTTLAEAVDLLSLSTCVLSNDSGLMHLAAAVRVPLVAIYGSSSPDYTPPLSSAARIARIDIACSPCFKRVCPLGHTRCLTDLKPDALWTMVMAAMAESRR